jgi:hypothetical protein
MDRGSRIRPGTRSPNGLGPRSPVFETRSVDDILESRVEPLMFGTLSEHVFVTRGGHVYLHASSQVAIIHHHSLANETAKSTGIPVKYERSGRRGAYMPFMNKKILF